MMAGPEPVCIAVAYSGGRDSTALLHATAVAARDWPGTTVLALHVHHGLSAQADDWLRHAEAVCESWAAEGLPVRLLSRCVSLSLSAGDSVEAVARAARHAALQDMAREADADLLLLAHHRQDQAETLLLQALRGGGLAGLAGMPRDVIREGVRWVRPWLDHPRSAVETYVAAHRLDYIDDDSNTDARYARNLLRMSVWPALVGAFPDAEANLAASARRLSDALPVMDAWREQALPPLLTSFEPAALEAAAEVAPALPRGLLLERFGAGWGEIAHRLGCVAVVAEQRAWTLETAAEARAAGLHLLAYTVNDDAQASRLLALGLDGLITDRVDHFRP